jgi:MYXO-CTERM domain-containing protein
MRVRGWTFCLPLVVLAIVLFAVAPAQAAVIFDNFGGGNGYNCCGGWTVSGATSGVGNEASAMDFTSTTAFTLSEIDVALGFVTGTNPGGVTLYLETSTIPAGGGAPNTVLDSWLLGTLPSLGTCCGIESVFGTDSLAANTQYWLVAIPASDTWAAWNDNSIGATGNMAGSQDNGSTWNLSSGQDQGAFRVLSGSSVPEPVTAFLAAAGLGLLAVLRRKRS